jgi:hypothetical protein
MGWTVRGSNPDGGEIFCTCPDRPWGPPSFLYDEYRVFPGGRERPGRDADLSPPSSAVVKKREELYLYSPYGSYCLYRASVSVQGCTYFLLFPKGCCIHLCSSDDGEADQKMLQRITRTDNKLLDVM